LDQIDSIKEPEVVYQSKTTKKQTLIDKYVAGAKDRFAIKAYIIRGKSNGDKFRIPPVNFAFSTMMNSIQNRRYRPYNGSLRH
jgi:hypothetical protein